MSGCSDFPLPTTRSSASFSTTASKLDNVGVRTGDSNGSRESVRWPDGHYNSPWNLVPPPDDSSNYLLELPTSMWADRLRPTFAQNLHLEGIRCGLQLVCTAEDNSGAFYQVFNETLNSASRREWKTIFGNILNGNLNQSLYPPPESGMYGSHTRRLFPIWLNASDVVWYFRSMGIDLNGPQGTITVKIPSKRPRNGPLQTQTLHATRSNGHHSQAWSRSSSRQMQDELECPRSMPPHTSLTATEDVSNFGVLAKRLACNSQRSDMMYLTIDASILLYGK
jgi:hypothetical protein